MLSSRILWCVVFIAVAMVAAWRDASPAALPFLPARLADLAQITDNNVSDADTGADKNSLHPIEVVRARVREGVPPPLCAGRCASPPAGPVCAFDAAGTARTFRTLCELEAVSCRESTHYAITSLGEC